MLDEKSVDPDQLTSTFSFRRVRRLCNVMHTVHLKGQIQ